MADIEQATVVIVGGGPVGLSSALLLERAGIDVLLLERRDFSTRFPRAHLLNVRTMEAFHDMGAADDIYSHAPTTDSWNRVAWYTSLAGPTPLHGRKIGQVDAWGGGHDLDRYAQASPRRFANLPQMRLDRLLWEKAAARCPDRILAEQEVVDIAARDDGVTVTIEDRNSGARRQVEASYVIAADGGRTCPELLDVELIGRRGIGRNVTTLYVTMDLADHADEQALLTWLISPLGNGGPAGTLQALGPGDWTNRSTEWSISVRPPTGTAYTDDEAVARAKEILGIEDLEINVRAVSRWQYDAIVAEHFRAGRVFLAGDAAHRHPPTGGLGLNTGVQDAHNLCWKLAAVINGWAGDELLDSYEAERRPIAVKNVEHSLTNASKHHHIAAAMGLHAGQSEADGWSELEIWASDSDEGKARRDATDQALATNAEDYSQLNIEAGFSYERGAIVADGTPPPPGHESPIDFKPTARPGHHVPHVWLEQGGERVSTVDLVAHDALTLFVAAAGAPAWRAAAERAIAEQGCRLKVVEIGPDAELQDPAAEWATICAIGRRGAILVRPDKHVAYRSADAPADVAGELGSAIRRVLHEMPADLAAGRLSLANIEHAVRELGEHATGASRLTRPAR